ncbi:patatin-like phospholipase family protein [Thermodesulfobacteriota bacterium]
MEENNIGLGLSGGGYRATLFNLGTLIRLNELGLMGKIKRITSVSGGSITNGYLAMHWNDLQFNDDGVIERFKENIVDPLWDFCSKSLDAGAIIWGTLDPFHKVSEKIARVYNDRLFKHFKMAAIPFGEGIPQFLFYGTNLQTGASVRMIQNMLYDWKIGATEIDDWELATAVGISSAFPPLLSPVILKLDPGKWIEGKYATCFDDVKYKEKLYLTDGGVYDNMGMESLWKTFANELANDNHKFKELLQDDIDSVLISDAGAPLEYQKKPGKNWFSLTKRALDIVTDQARAVRKRWLIDKFIRKELSGTYWGITTKIDNYDLPDALVRDNKVTRGLREIKTRLSKFSDTDKGKLINWGYALADAGMRKHMKDILIKKIPEPRWPFPEYSLKKGQVDS